MLGRIADQWRDGLAVRTIHAAVPPTSGLSMTPLVESLGEAVARWEEPARECVILRAARWKSRPSSGRALRIARYR